MKIFDDKVNFIYNNTKGYPHSRKTFFEHLLNTSNIIRELFPEKQYLIDAGLFHSIYGTCYYEFDCKKSREQIKSIIGEKAENLVHIFCTLEDRTYKIIENEFDGEIQKDLLILEYANCLEQECDNEILLEIKSVLYEKFSIQLPSIKTYSIPFTYY